MNVARRNLSPRWVAGLFALTVGYSLLPGPAAAQVAKESQPKPYAPEAVKPNESVVVKLKYIQAAHTAELLQTALGWRRGESTARFVSDERTNSILVLAPASEIARVQEIIAKLDTPDADGGTAKLTVFPLRHLTPDKALENALRMVFGGDGNFSIDLNRKSVIVSGDKKTTDAVEALLERLESVQAAARKPESDKPAGDAQVRIVWLVNGPAKDEAPLLPDDLKEVLPGLAKMGIDRPRLAAQALVAISPGRPFQAKGVAKLDGPCQFIMVGSYGNGNAPELSITISATSQGERGPPVEVVHLETEITAPIGHLLVLGITPTETLTSVFVVQVLRPDAKK